jgi:hypothetical protein
VVAVEAERPGVGHQQGTSVVRAHRGHRLGLLLNTDMMLWLADAEPELRTVDTFNAESNDHMIAANEELGYRWMGEVSASSAPSTWSEHGENRWPARPRAAILRSWTSPISAPTTQP